MTLDDLIEEFRTQPTTHAGIRAVVAALRFSSLVSRKPPYLWFDDILASDGERHLTVQEQDIVHSALRRGVKAAGGPTREEGGTDEKRESNSLPTDGAEVSPRLPDPAADVCEWTRDAEAGAFNPSCDEWSKWTYSDPMDDPESEGYNFCPSCGKPIRFVEVKKW